MPEAQILTGGYATGKVRLEPTDIKAEGGPFFPRLTIPVCFDLNPAQQGPNFVTITTECGLYVTDFGPKIADAVVTISPYPVRSSVSITRSLEFPLDPFRVQGLEGKRHGDLKLRLDLFFVVGVLGRTQGSQGIIDVVTQFERTATQIYAEVPQSHWVGKVLPELGSHRYFLVEIPTQHEHIGSAWSLIEKAEAAFGRWDTKSVFVHCREAADALAQIVTKSHAANSFVVAERWGRAIKEFRHFASLDLHLEEKRAGNSYSSEEVAVSKMDAECLLIFTKALAKYAEELVR